jgi:hypothetical protein
MDTRNTQSECCPRFDPAPWDNKTHEWDKKPFIKDSIPLVMHMPWPPTVGKVMVRMWDAARKANATPADSDCLCLAYDPSPWRSEFFLAVTKEVPGAENMALSGTFISKVFEGPYRNVPKWMKQMDALLAEQNKKAIKHYFYYTTCPKCAKKYGKNYVVVFAQIQ